MKTKAERRSCEFRKKASLLSSSWVKRVLSDGYYSEADILSNPYLWRISGMCRRNRRTASVGDHCSWCLSNLTYREQREKERTHQEELEEANDPEPVYGRFYDYDDYDCPYSSPEEDWWWEWQNRDWCPIQRIVNKRILRQVPTGGKP